MMLKSLIQNHGKGNLFQQENELIVSFRCIISIEVQIWASSWGNQLQSQTQNKAQ